jgi:probable selenium-dependent hydroxylase accessory protein YqeC
MHVTSLQSILRLSPDACVALIGAGGKTTIMLALAGEVCAAGFRPVVTTTTRIWPPAGVPLVLDDLDVLAQARADNPIVCFGRGLSPEEKIEGVTPATVCELLDRGIGPLLVEADGAARRPLKVHAAHEPVVPACASVVLIVAGVDAVGQPVGDDVIHRSGLAKQLPQWPEGETVTPAHVAALLRPMESHVPGWSRSWFVLNKVDGPSEAATAQSIAAELAGRRSPVLMTSRGGAVRVTEPTQAVARS